MRSRSLSKLCWLVVAAALSIVPTVVSGQSSASEPNAKDPALAIALGLAVPGLGHLYLGETGSAIRYGLPGVAGAVVALSRRREDATTELAAFCWLGSYALSLFDLPDAIRRHQPQRPGPVVAIGVARRAIAVRFTVE